MDLHHQEHTKLSLHFNLFPCHSFADRHSLLAFLVLPLAHCLFPPSPDLQPNVRRRRRGLKQDCRRARGQGEGESLICTHQTSWLLCTLVLCTYSIWHTFSFILSFFTTVVLYHSFIHSASHSFVVQNILFLIIIIPNPSFLFFFFFQFILSDRFSSLNPGVVW